MLRFFFILVNILKITLEVSLYFPCVKWNHEQVNFVFPFHSHHISQMFKNSNQFSLRIKHSLPLSNFIPIIKNLCNFLFDELPDIWHWGLQLQHNLLVFLYDLYFLLYGATPFSGFVLEISRANMILLTMVFVTVWFMICAFFYDFLELLKLILVVFHLHLELVLDMFLDLPTELSEYFGLDSQVWSVFDFSSCLLNIKNLLFNILFSSSTFHKWWINATHYNSFWSIWWTRLL
mgnify:CR=1 FL=1